MRDLKSSDKNKLVISDARSGTEIELYYRSPTTQEEAAFQSKLLKRKGNKIVFNSHETRLEFGLKILTGFREGDFGFDGDVISSNPMSSNYTEDWKDRIKTGASDMVSALAMTVFEGARVSGADIEFAEAEGLEETSPLAKS